MSERVIGPFVFLVSADRLMVFRLTWSHALGQLGSGLVVATIGAVLAAVARWRPEPFWLPLGAVLLVIGSVIMVVRALRFGVRFTLSHHTGRLDYGTQALAALADILAVEVRGNWDDGYDVYLHFADRSPVVPPDWRFFVEADADQFAELVREFAGRAGRMP